MNITYASSVAAIDLRDAGTVIYDDLTGIYAGFENIAIFSGDLVGSVLATTSTRYVNIGILKPGDAGTYFCSGSILQGFGTPGSYPLYFFASGGINLMVNTKPGQAHSSFSKPQKLLTYSAMLLGASKLLF